MEVQIQFLEPGHSVPTVFTVEAALNETTDLVYIGGRGFSWHHLPVTKVRDYINTGWTPESRLTVPAISMRLIQEAIDQGKISIV